MDDSLSFKDSLILQANCLLGVTLACIAGLMTILGGLLVYNTRFSFLRAPQSLAISLGLSTGGVLCFSFIELLPPAQDAFQRILNEHYVSIHMQDAYAALVLSCTFALGVMMVWVLDTLCLYCVLPKTIVRAHTLYESCTSQPRMTNQQTLPLSSSHNAVLQDEWFMKERLYKTVTAKFISFSIQNIPVGMVLGWTTVQRTSFGILFTCTIALYTMTQGMMMVGSFTQTSDYRWRPVMWCVLSALALPLGAFLSWVILLQTSLESFVYGIFYAIVSGLLVGMCWTQTLVFCYNYKSTNNHWITWSVLGGMVQIASVRMLLCFLYNE